MFRVRPIFSLVLVLLIGQALATPIAQGTTTASPGQNCSSESNTYLHKRALAHLNPQWRNMPGALKQVQLDGNVVCGVNVADQIYCADQNIFFNLVWDPLPGRLMHVSVSNGRLYGVSRDGKIWYGESYKVPNWRQVPGEGRMVDLDVNVACHVALRSNNVFCAELGNDFANPQWFQVRGPQLKSVSVSIGRLYGITTRNQIVYTESLRNPRWTLVPGSLTQVELRGRIVCGVNDRDEIFCASGDVANPQWKQLNGALRHVSVSNGALYGVNRADMIYSAV